MFHFHSLSYQAWKLAVRNSSRWDRTKSRRTDRTPSTPLSSEKETSSHHRVLKKGSIRNHLKKKIFITQHDTKGNTNNVLFWIYLFLIYFLLYGPEIYNKHIFDLYFGDYISLLTFQIILCAKTKIEFKLIFLTKCS